MLRLLFIISLFTTSTFVYAIDLDSYKYTSTYRYGGVGYERDIQIRSNDLTKIDGKYYFENDRKVLGYANVVVVEDLFLRNSEPDGRTGTQITGDNITDIYYSQRHFSIMSLRHYNKTSTLKITSSGTFSMKLEYIRDSDVHIYPPMSYTFLDYYRMDYFKSFTVIKDFDGPTGLGFLEKSYSPSSYYHAISGSSYQAYIRPGITLDFEWSTATDVVGVSSYKFNNNKDGDFKSSIKVPIEQTSDIIAKLVVEDKLGHTSSKSIKYIVDYTAPTQEDIKDIPTDFQNENDKFGMRFRYKIFDTLDDGEEINGSGIEGNPSARWNPQSGDDISGIFEDEEYSDTLSNGTYAAVIERVVDDSNSQIENQWDIVFNNFLYDYEYYYTLQTTDNVSNIRKTNEILFGRTKPPVIDGLTGEKMGEFIIEENGKVYYRTGLIVGKNFDNTNILGYNSLEIDFDGLGYENPISIDINSTYIQEDLSYPEKNSQSDTRYLTLTLPIDFDRLAFHGDINTTVRAKYNDGTYSTNTDENTILVTVPNIVLNEYNNFNLSFKRYGKSVETLSFNNLIENPLGRSLYFNESFELELEGLQIDKEGDHLYLEYIDLNNNQVYEESLSNNTLSFDSGDSIRLTKILEKSSDGSITYAEYDLNQEILFSLVDLSTVGIELDSDLNPTASSEIWANKDGKINWDMNLSSMGLVPGGIYTVTMFEYPFDMKDDLSREYFITNAQNLKQFTYEENNINPYNYALSEIAEDTEVLRNTGVLVEDYAGNQLFVTRAVHYDRISPEKLDPSDSNILWFDANDITADNLSFGHFNNLTSELFLKLDDSHYLSEEIFYSGVNLNNCRIEITGLDQYEFVEGLQLGISDDTETSEIITLKLREGYPPDSPISFNLTLFDYAGNKTENNLTVYTPLYFSGNDQSQYIVKTEKPDSIDNEWSDTDGHYFEWDQVEFPGAELRVYHGDVNKGLKHVGLDPHDVVDYTLRGVNQSGYESRYTGFADSVTDPSVINFSREGLNNSPIITSYKARNAFEAENGVTFTGPEDTYVINYRDYDLTDTLTLQWLIKGENEEDFQLYNEDPYLLTPNGAGEVVFNVRDYFTNANLENGKEYHLRFAITDTWEVGPGLDTVVPTTKSLVYTYDDEAPSFTYLFDKVESFPYIKGDVHLNIYDEGSGLNTEIISTTPSDNILLSDDHNLEGYTHMVSQIPDGLDHMLGFTLIDNVGNINSSASIGPFSKDSVSPSLTSVELSNAASIFSRPIIPISLEWEDNLSGADRIVYRFMDGDTVIKSGDVSLFDKEAFSSNGIWDVSCVVSESLISSGNNYSLQVKVLDQAGNGNDAEWTTIGSSLTIDSIPPVITIGDISGLVQNQGKYFYTGNSVVFNYRIADENADSSVWYEIEGEEGPYATTSSLFSQLTEGNPITVKLGTKDLAGNVGYSNSISIVKDTSPPSSSVISFNNENLNSLSAGSQVRFNFTSSDDISGIDFLDLWIGQSVEGVDIPFITRELPGHSADGTISYAYVPGKIYSFNVPDVASGSYVYKASVKDKAGNVSSLSALSGPTLGIIQTTERLVVQDYSSYSNSINELKAYFKYEGNKELNHYSYRVKSASDGLPVSDWETSFLDYGTAQLSQNTVEGENYYFEVYARFNDGSRSSSSFSPGTFIDHGVPTIISADVPAYGTLGDLNISWDSTDVLSPIASVEVILDTYKTDSDGTTVLIEDGKGGVIPVREEIGLFSLGNSAVSSGISILTLQNIDSLSIVDGQKLFLTLRVSDLAGNMCEAPVGVFVKDHSVPPVPAVIDNGDFINPDKMTLNPLTFNWMWSGQDEHSGHQAFYYQLLTVDDPIDEGGWIEISDPEVISPDLTGFENGSQVICAVKTVNGAGLSSLGYSNGIVLDNSKPDIAKVILTSDGSSDAEYLITSNGSLLLQSEDQQSGISKYEYEAGTFDGTEWVAFEDPKETLSSDNTISIDIPEIDPLTVLYYKATAFNATGDASSLPGYSRGAKYFEGIPMIRNIIGESKNGSLIFTWDAESYLPITEISYVLKKSGIEIDRGYFSGNTRTLQFDGVVDGDYMLSLSYKAANGVVSDENVFSTNVRVDNTAPAIDQLYYDHYINDFLNYRFAIIDNLSGADGYRYQIGPVGYPDLLTEGWRSVGLVGALENRNLSILNDLQGGAESVDDGDSILLSLQLKDRSGNWSSIMFSDPILVDRTAPGVPIIDHNLTLDVNGEEYTQSKHYIFDKTSIDKLTIEGLDEESGIKGFKWALGTSTNPDGLGWSQLVGIGSDPGKLNLLLEDYTLAVDALQDKEKYSLFIKVVNKSGILSEPGMSPLLVTDFTAPEFNFDLTSGLALDDEKLVFNESGDVFIEVTNEASEVLIFDYSLIGESGYVSDVTSETLLGVGNTILAALFSPPDPDAYGTYTLEARLTDAGGRITIKSQMIRLNAPPNILSQPVVSNPMKPFDIPLSTWIDDTDGVKSYDVTLEGQTFNFVSGQDLLNIAFDHKELFAGKTEYPFTITATDTYLQSITADAVFTIINTQKGILLVDEYWTGSHQITGEVLVPPGLTLNLDIGTEVHVVSPSEGGSDPAIIIEEGASLNHTGSATYQLFDRTLDYKWDGIVIKGTANFNNVIVKDAIRGLSLIGADVPSLSGIRLENNETGLHLWNSAPLITGSSFIGNHYYGVKEDAGASPPMTGNWFSENGFDYYDTDLTVMTADSLNTLPGNSGNWGDN